MKLNYAMRTLSVFTILLSILWPRYLFFSVLGFGVNPLTISIMAITILSLYYVFTRTGYSAAIGVVDNNKLLFASFSLFVIWRLISVAFSDDPSLSFQSFVREGFIFILLPVFSLIFCDVRCRQSLVKIILGGGLLQLLLAASEQIMQSSLAGFLQLDTLGVGEKGALAQIASERIRDGSYRSQAFFSHPIILGHFSAALSVLFAAKLFVSKRVSGRIFSAFALALSVSATAFSGTRSSLLLLILGITIFLALYKRDYSVSSSRHALKMTTIASIAAIVMLFGGSWLEEFVNGRTSSEAGSTETRSLQLYNGVEALSEHPIVGFGLGLGDRYGGVVNQFGQATVDNYYLSVTLDSGYVGLSLWIFFIIASLRSTAKALAKEPLENYNVGIALLTFNLILFFGLLVQSITDLVSIQMIVIGWFLSSTSGQRNDGRKDVEFYGPTLFSLAPPRH